MATDDRRQTTHRNYLAHCGMCSCFLFPFRLAWLFVSFLFCLFRPVLWLSGDGSDIQIARMIVVISTSSMLRAVGRALDLFTFMFCDEKCSKLI